MEGSGAYTIHNHATQSCHPGNTPSLPFSPWRRCGLYSNQGYLSQQLSTASNFRSRPTYLYKFNGPQRSNHPVPGYNLATTGVVPGIQPDYLFWQYISKSVSVHQARISSAWRTGMHTCVLLAVSWRFTLDTHPRKQFTPSCARGARSMAT